MNMNMDEKFYRRTKLGIALKASLEELTRDKKLGPRIAMKIMNKFDKSIINILEQEAKLKMSFKSERLKTFNLVDGVWKFVLNDVVLTDVGGKTLIDKVAIIAFSKKKFEEEIIQIDSTSESDASTTGESDTCSSSSSSSDQNDQKENYKRKRETSSSSSSTSDCDSDSVIDVVF